ncbi:MULTISPECIES: glycosyltransferase [Burkholderia]|uniref:Glycosyl transferases group 1 family protein n=1 Tax=Burkholderia cepacia TaxID=292 RepID=A0AA88YU56_BURCE|nr:MULTISPECIES: glycosyltransferase [Burkholderia]KGB91736.1 glycosyl transferases group 1 family protein [Burkholderia cepacia]KWE59563.1 glycosyl transferase family 1 [Burkholderia sp. MSMB2157WGS]
MSDIHRVDHAAARDARHAPAPRAAETRTTGAPRLRIALVAEAAGGGVATHLSDLIDGLSAVHGIDVHLIVPDGPRFDDKTLDARVLSRCASVHRVPMQRHVGWRDALAVVRLYRCLLRIRPDIVHSHSSKAGAIARLCIGPWRQVYTPHAVYTLNPSLNGLQRRFYGTIEQMLGRLCTHRIIAVSEDEARHLRDALGIPAHRVKTIVNGVRPLDTMPQHDARQALGLPDDAIVVGFVGRFDHQKGVDRLVRIARAVHRQCNRDVQFVAIGPGDFNAAAGPEAEYWPPNLHVAGVVEHASRYFSAFDLFALPSRYEGFPYVCLEAMAAGVPIVASQVAGAAELIRSSEIGVVVPNDDDTTDFKHAVVALARDAALRSAMRARCVPAARCHSADAMVRRTLDLYRSLVPKETS